MNIKNALTRKFGPLPAWAWFLVLAGGVWYYRRKTGGSVSGTGTGSVGPAPTTPQPGQVLQPGESYYDPNSGALTTAPGGGGGIGGGVNGTDPNQPLTDLATAIEQAIAAATPGTLSPNPNGAPSIGGPPPPGKSRILAPPGYRFGGKNPGKGWVGIGGGWWRRRNVKSKTKNVKPPDKHSTTKRSRTNATIHHPRPSKPKTITAQKSKVARNSSMPPSFRLRKRQLTPAVKPVVRQRPVASIRPSHRQSAAPNHRPSAPPPRKHRVQRHK